jgi:hypothetical protein
MDGKKTSITAEELDKLFDEGKEDITQYFDMDNTKYPGLEARTVAVDLPAYLFDALQEEASKRGLLIEELVRAWVADKLGLENAAPR